MTEDIKDQEAQVTPKADDQKSVEKSDEEILYNDDKKESEEKKSDDSSEKENKTDENNDKKSDEKSDDKDDDSKEKEEKKSYEKKYELKMPENSLLPKEMVDEVISYAKEKNLEPEVAQEILEMRSKDVQTYHENLMARAEDLAVNEWPKLAQEDKEIGGEKFAENVEMAKRAFKTFGDDEFNSLIELKSDDNPNGQGYGNHPALLRVFARIGKAMANDSLVLGTTQTIKEKSTADVLFGDE